MTDDKYITKFQQEQVELAEKEFAKYSKKSLISRRICVGLAAFALACGMSFGLLFNKLFDNIDDKDKFLSDNGFDDVKEELIIKIKEEAITQYTNGEIVGEEFRRRMDHSYRYAESEFVANNLSNEDQTKFSEYYDLTNKLTMGIALTGSATYGCTLGLVLESYNRSRNKRLVKQCQDRLEYYKSSEYTEELVNQKKFHDFILNNDKSTTYNGDANI